MTLQDQIDLMSEEVARLERAVADLGVEALFHIEAKLRWAERIAIAIKVQKEAERRRKPQAWNPAPHIKRKA